MSVLGRERHEIEAEAATWVIRLGQGLLRNEERQALDRWLEENPVHQAAFDRARSAWDELGELRSAPGTLLDDVAASPQPSLVPMGRRHFPAAGMRHAAAAVALLVVGVGLGLFWFGDPALVLQADYQTAPGETRSVTLADGSLVQLNTDSALAVRFDDGERRVELLAGEAYFIVAPLSGTESRRFVVEAANGSATALGTEFIVDRSESTKVTVVEHQVEVSATARDGGRSIVLSPGQSVRYDRAGGMEKAEEVNLQRATAWRRGELVFDKALLTDVVAELNRYRRGKIVIAGAGLASRRVSGFFQTGDLEGALGSMTRELGVRAVNLPPFLTVLY